MSSTAMVPPTLTKYVHEGLHIEIRTAAEVVAELSCGLPVEVYREPLKRQCEALSLLEDMGGETPDPPVAFEVELAKHHAILLLVCQAQQRCAIETTEIMDEAEERDAVVRVQDFDTLIRTVQRYKEGQVT